MNANPPTHPPTHPSQVSRLRIAPDRFDFLMNGSPSFTRPVKAHPALLFFLDKYNIPFYAGRYESIHPLTHPPTHPFVFIFSPTTNRPSSSI